MLSRFNGTYKLNIDYILINIYTSFSYYINTNIVRYIIHLNSQPKGNFLEWRDRCKYWDTK